MLTVIEKVLLLQDIDFFELGYTEHLAQLAAISKETQVTGGTVLFREDEPCTRFHLVLKGEVVLEKEGTTVRTIHRGGLDFWSFFSEAAHQFTATSTTSTDLLTLSYEDMADLLTAEPEFCWAILKRLAAFGRQETEPILEEDGGEGSRHPVTQLERPPDPNPSRSPDKG